MATKTQYTYEGQTKQAYLEGPLILWPTDDKQWIVVHKQIGLTVCGDKVWSKKSEALNYALSLIDYEEAGRKIMLDTGDITVFYQVNDRDFLLRAWEKLKEF